MHKIDLTSSLLRTVTLAALPLLATPQGNVLIIVADDVGVDQIAAYGLGSTPPATPHIGTLAAQGVTFLHAWATPVCSSTRAALMTGRHGFRTRVGGVIGPGEAALQPWELTLPELVHAGAAGAYSMGAFGKWHLGEFAEHMALTGDLSSALEHGWTHFAGTLQNIASYYYFVMVKDDRAQEQLGYATSATVDEFLLWLEDAPQPWLAYLSFNAAHVPLNAPPPHLHNEDLSLTTEQDPAAYYRATIEAMDTEIGRALEGIGDAIDQTSILFLGDNGSSPQNVTAPFDPARSKGTPYEGGVRVPMIFKGPEVQQPGATCAGLVHVVDVFATAAELCGVDISASYPPQRTLDGRSLVPWMKDPGASGPREVVYTEQFEPNGHAPLESRDRAIRDLRYKLIVRESYQPSYARQEELYDLLLDPYEDVDLLLTPPLAPTAAQAYRSLRSALRSMMGALKGPLSDPK